MNIDKGVTEAFEGKSFKELAKAPTHALQGVSENDAKLLKKAFKIKTISDMAHNKYFKWARAIAIAAELEE